MSWQIDDICKALGLSSRCGPELSVALTHASYAYEHGLDALANNERLEFLGDAVLQLAVSQELYARCPDLTEGQLTKMRAALVCESTLAALARSLGLGDFLRLGHGERQTGGQAKESNLANAMEAVFAAIYLSEGYEFCQSYIVTHLEAWTQLALQGRLQKDYKSQFLEVLHHVRPAAEVCFRIVRREGPVHAPVFYAELSMDQELLAEGKGHSKKEAEKAAAKQALLDPLVPWQDSDVS